MLELIVGHEVGNGGHISHGRNLDRHLAFQERYGLTMGETDGNIILFCTWASRKCEPGRGGSGRIRDVGGRRIKGVDVRWTLVGLH